MSRVIFRPIASRLLALFLTLGLASCACKVGQIKIIERPLGSAPSRQYFLDPKPITEELLAKFPIRQVVDVEGGHPSPFVKLLMRNDEFVYHQSLLRISGEPAAWRYDEFRPPTSGGLGGQAKDWYYDSDAYTAYGVIVFSNGRIFRLSDGPDHQFLAFFPRSQLLGVGAVRFPSGYLEPVLVDNRMAQRELIRFDTPTMSWVAVGTFPCGGFFPSVRSASSSDRVLISCSGRLYFSDPRQGQVLQILLAGVPPGSLIADIWQSNDGALAVVKATTTNAAVPGGYEYRYFLIEGRSASEIGDWRNRRIGDLHWSRDSLVIVSEDEGLGVSTKLGAPVKIIVPDVSCMIKSSGEETPVFALCDDISTANKEFSEAISRPESPQANSRVLERVYSSSDLGKTWDDRTEEIGL